MLVYIECIDIQYVQKMVNTEFYASRTRTIMVMPLEWMDKRMYVILIHMAIVTKI